MSRCSVSGQPAGWVERLVRRSSTSEGGSDAHRLRAAKMMGFASAQPFLRVKTGKTREKPHFHGWRISRLGTIFAWRSSHILSNIRSRQWAKSCDLFRNQSWNGPASFAKPARTMIAFSRRPIQPANVRNRTNEQRVGRGRLGAIRHSRRANSREEPLRKELRKQAWLPHECVRLSVVRLGNADYNRRVLAYRDNRCAYDEADLRSLDHR